MKTELKKLAEDLATKLENEAEGKKTYDLYNDALKACHELCRAIGTGHSHEELPAIAALYSIIVDTLPAASLGFFFWKENGDETEECDTWAECSRAMIELYELSYHGKLEDMASEIADCIFNAVDHEPAQRHYDRDCAYEWVYLYKHEN